MADPRGVEHPQRTIALWSALLRIQGPPGRTAQRPIQLEREIGSGKPFGVRWAGPLWRPVGNGGWWRLAARQDQVQAHPSGQKHIPSCAWAWDGVHAPIPGAGSTPIAPGFAKTPGPTWYENTIDLWLAPGLQKLARTQTLPDANRDLPPRQG